MQREKRMSQRDVMMDRWNDIISALTTALHEIQFFRANISNDQIQTRLTKSNLSWHCADAFLFLSNFGDAHDTEKYAQILLDSFSTWCKEACAPTKPKIISKKDENRGYFEHRYLSEITADISDHFTHRLHKCFLSFLKGMNLSFRRKEDSCDRFNFDVQTQRDAFSRFSLSLEKESSKNSPICEGIENLVIH
jgi:hypothetical protein